MESLQMAQMLADLSSLNAAEPNAAAALVTANKAIQKVEQDRHSLAAPRRPSDDLRRAQSAQAIPRTNTGSASPSAGTGPARHDKFGRRILMSPPLTRTNSAQGSVPGTPRRDSDPEDDLDRASTLMALYDIRAKLKQQDNSSLMKAREKIAELAARQQAQAQAGAGAKREADKGPPRYSYPK
ncbi:hypothetical protein D7B24_002086 [Verticillium nonalfalfae]|uniref:Uncharacterized protein n=1 Tax=Verticillium nonalfalfae TaxID=1051616 RepID=A0A3M9XY94_9PEZI|nr:uncharacterized protein D7B24_002086 [Verticillium nonalfalfae]RNJ53239.1 hypothetical protein D7B24_002086 [Verticillium nonalfalfae]